MNRLDLPRRNLAIALAALAGFVDAAGFLSADRYFVSFMSGNTTRLGVDLARDPGRAWVPAALIAGFVLGVIAGALIAAGAGERRKPAVLLLVTALLTAAAAMGAGGYGGAALGTLVLAMGALNNTFQRGGEVAVGLTYMTGALVRLGQGIADALRGGTGLGWGNHLALWLGLAMGAALGAAAWTWTGMTTLWLAALWAGALTLMAQRLSRAAA